MSRVERSALVRASAERMFDLVNDVERYPDRFGWCDAAQVLSSGEREMVARLELRLGSLRTAFTTRNTLDPGRAIDLQLVEGPFTALSGHWQFIPLTEQACRVSLMLDFELAGRFIGSALASGFGGLADRMVDDFVREARRVHVV